MAERLNITVVGCGVAGATVALLLARDGHRVTLFEQSERVGPVGAGILLQPSGQRVLRDIGLLDQVIAGAEPIAEIYATTHRGRDLVRLRYGDLYDGCTGYGLHRGDLFTVLHGAMLAAGVQLRLNQPVARYTQDREAISPINPSGRSLGPFDLLIAADGAKSRLRESSRIRRWIRPYGYGAVWAVGRHPGVHGQLRQVTRGTHRLCGLLPMGGGRCSLFWGLHEREWPTLQAGPFGAWRDEVVGLQAEAAPMFDGLSGFEQVKFVRYQHTSMSRWRDGRAVFIGDAGHSMSPHLGQGVNLALADAQQLRISIRRSECVQQALDYYGRTRRRHVLTYAAVTFGLTPFFQSAYPLLGMARDLGLPLLPKVRPVRRLMLRALSGELGRIQPRELKP